MNVSVENFISDFESNFSSQLRLPDFSDKKSFSKYFKYENQPPNHNLSDWDLKCWLNMEVISRNDIRKIDTFIREHRGLSDVGLFSKPTQNIENGLQYMAHTPSQSYAPFLDLHLRGPIDKNIWSVVCSGREDEHQKWAIFTGWRKIKKGDIDTQFGARTTYKGHIKGYWPNGEQAFIADPKTFYLNKFPRGNIPESLR